MGQPVKKITIVGGGTSGWISACYLARYFAQRLARGELSITLIESPDVGIIGVGESTARPMSDLLRIIGIKESEFIKRCDATFKLSGKFVNWDHDENGQPESWINPFFSQSDLHGVNPAYLYANYAMHPGGGPKDEDFTSAISVCPALVDARRGPRKTTMGDYEWDVPYSYHMNAVELAKILMEHGRKLGVTQILDHVEDILLDEKGNVSTLKLRENGDHDVEFIIDATGFIGLIINKALDEPFDPYDQYLLNDRAAVMQLPHEDPEDIEPASRATGMDAGWSFHVPLFNRIGTGYIFSSKFLTDDEAVAEFKSYIGERGRDVDMRIIPMRIGKARRSWVKNCLAVGLSSGFVEPLEATAIYSVQVALQWFTNYFPDIDGDEVVRGRYNRLIDNLYDEIVDFISLLFCTSNREDTPYWRAVRHEMDIPPRLKENLEIWRHTMPEELDLPNRTFFTPTSYRAALMGKGYFKGRDYAQCAPIGERGWNEYIGLRRERTRGLLQTLPSHYELLRHIRGEAPVRTSLNFSLGGSVLTGGGI